MNEPIGQIDRRAGVTADPNRFGPVSGRTDLVGPRRLQDFSPFLG
jgi:hypothetical protein